MAKPAERALLTAAGREIAISNPGKVLFPQAGHTKLDLARYYLAVADGALRGAGGRPNVLVRYPNGTGGEFFFQKRAPESRLPWIEVVTLSFPSGRTAEEVVPRDAATLLWMANLACLELHPHPVRADDLDHPDELRIDLDPVPGVEWPQIRDVAKVVRATLEDLGLVGWPKTSGSRGIHVYVRIERRWIFDEVRRAALAFAREVERRAPDLATSKWWKEERHGVFLDYNQNAKDRTIASAYSVRPDARRACVGAAHMGGDRRLQPCRFHAGDDAGKVRAGGRSPRWHRRASVLARAPARTVGTAGTRRPGRRAVAAALQEAGGRTGARAAVEAANINESAEARAKAEASADRNRPRAEKEDALAGLERWKARHAEAASHLEPADVLVDAMRGRFKTWTRIRVNLQHVPEDERPPQEALDPDETPNDWGSVKDRSAWLGRRRRPNGTP